MASLIAAGLALAFSAAFAREVSTVQYGVSGGFSSPHLHFHVLMQPKAMKHSILHIYVYRYT